jgi:two-component sensor histidine kinase
VNHRVSNSLQLVTASVHMQAAMLTDPAAKGALMETQQRIQAIAQVHRPLYSSGDVEFVAMDDYLRALVAELEQSWSTPTSPRRMLARASATHFRLSVEDDGGGMSKDGSIKGAGLGTKLIRAMASSMQAEISFDPATAGARATLNAPY